MPRKNAHPHVAWRNGRPRFSPDQNLRTLGYQGKDLRHADGTWYSKGEAVDWSEKFQAELAAHRAALKGKLQTQAATAARTSRAPARPARPKAYPIAQLLEDWQRSPRWQAADGKGGKRLSENTKRDYRQKLRVIEEDHPLIWNAPAHLIGQPVLHRAYEAIWMARGLATARGAMLVLSSAFSWGIRAGYVKRRDNPARRLGMEISAPRVRFATRKELAALIAAADALGRPEVADMIVLAVWTGQRQADRLALQAGQVLNGRRVFRQGKTGAIVWIRQTPELEARIKAAGERRAAAKAEALLKAATPAEREKVLQRFAHVVLDEAFDPRPGWQKKRFMPFTRHHYSHVFAEVRDLAVKGSEELGLSPCASLADFWDLDLRDTAVTYMALAGATIPEIVSVTGHTAESATRILRHYLAQHPAMADSAIGKMLTWYEGGGETEFGL